jgi:hypothetical protein
MPSLRHLRFLSLPLAAWVLALFLMSFGVMAALPVIHMGRMELVCSASGVTKVVVQSDGDSNPQIAHTVHCPLCLLAGAPPSFIAQVTAFAGHSLFALAALASAPLVLLTGAPLPARGPPALG